MKKELVLLKRHFLTVRCASSTMGARDFSCAVSCFGQVFVSVPREKHFSRGRKSVPTAREKKPSSTQGMPLENRIIKIRDEH